MANKYLKVRLQQLRNTHEYWYSDEAVTLMNGEIGYDLDEKIFKIGDGEHKFPDLPNYYPHINLDGTTIVDAGAINYEEGSIPVTLKLANEESAKFSESYVPLKGEPVSYLNSDDLQGLKIGDGRRSFQNLKYTTPFDDVITRDAGEVEDFVI